MLTSENTGLRRTGHYGEVLGKGSVFGCFCEGLTKGEFNQNIRGSIGTYQIPSFTFNCPKFILAHDSKDTLGSAGIGMKSEVQRGSITGLIAEVVESVKELEDDLDWVMTRPESEYGV